MKVLITGGAGFVGSHLADKYLALGYEVVIVDDFSTGKQSNIDLAVKNGAKVYKAKLQSPAIQEILKKEKPDLISHHCAQKSVRDSVTDPQKDADINLMGLIHLMEAARETSCRKIIYASSGGVVYGETSQIPTDESHPKRPMSPYGITKYTSELYLDYYVQEFGFHATCLRYANIYGPRQDPAGEAGVVAIFSQKMKAQENMSIFGTGKQTRDFVFVGDVVLANIAAEKNLKGFQAFNIGTGKETSILEIHQTLAKISNYEKTVTFEPARSGEQMRSCLSYENFKKATGWQPQTNLEQGLKQTYEWILRSIT
ncbi:MAG: NAD-dependent epimerase/dehydratase family protein [Deltaproteobacteria bacterium]|nr:NAD-dependent epimerase/dehydratase family protein [Deltaproteobacteria bacterium]